VTPTGEQVAKAWQQASPAAVHPELGHDGLPKSDGSAQLTIMELDTAVRFYVGDPSELDLLDYAAGPGRLARLGAHFYNSWLCADVNPRYLDIAAKIPGVSTLHVDTLPGSLPSVDVILCVNLFLHIPHDLAQSLLRLFARTLRPGGLLALQLPIYDEGVLPLTWTSVGVWTPAQFESYAAAAGLAVLELQANTGTYQRSRIGANHARLHFLCQLPTSP
jgi:SAM-dependent methyltransferase